MTRGYYPSPMDRQQAGASSLPVISVRSDRALRCDAPLSVAIANANALLTAQAGRQVLQSAS